jgi:hypothetical protein
MVSYGAGLRHEAALSQVAKVVPALLTEKQTRRDVVWGRAHTLDQRIEHPLTRRCRLSYLEVASLLCVDIC